MCFLIVIFGSSVARAASWRSGGQPQAAATPTPFVVPTPEATPVLETVVNADGALVSTRPTLGLGFQVTGRVVEVLVRPGDTVKADQVLARLDTLTLENAVRDAKARLEQSRFDLDKAKRTAESGTDLKAAEKAVEAARLGVVNAQGNYASTQLRADVTGDVQMAKFWADYWADDLGDKWLASEGKPEQRLEAYPVRGSWRARRPTRTARMLQITQDAQKQCDGGAAQPGGGAAAVSVGAGILRLAQEQRPGEAGRVAGDAQRDGADARTDGPGERRAQSAVGGDGRHGGHCAWLASWAARRR